MTSVRSFIKSVEKFSVDNSPGILTAGGVVVALAVACAGFGGTNIVACPGTSGLITM